MSRMISLVLATIERTRTVERLLESLNNQDYREFEVIVVDQNTSEILKPILEKYERCFPITHVRCCPGLSRARNAGLLECAGEIIGFPDDDCWYPPNLLKEVATFYEGYPDCSGVLGRLVWKSEARAKAHRSTEQVVTRYSATTRTHSTTMFVLRKAVTTVRGFDEKMGLGAGTKWGGGEDIDFVVRLLQAGFTARLHPELVVFHPDPRKRYVDPGRGFRYGMGLGRVLAKHRYRFWFVLYHLARSLAASTLAIGSGRTDKARYYWGVFQGKQAGWWRSRIRPDKSR